MNAVVKEIQPRDIMPVRMKMADVARNVFQVVVESGVTRKQILDSKFWKHVSRQFEPYSKIEVVTDDGAYFCELLVIDSGTNWAVVKELSYTELQQSDAEREASVLDEYSYKFKGPHLKHAIIRKSDNEVIKDGMGSKDEAIRFLSEYVRTITK